MAAGNNSGKRGVKNLLDAGQCDAGRCNMTGDRDRHMTKVRQCQHKEMAYVQRCYAVVEKFLG